MILGTTRVKKRDTVSPVPVVSMDDYFNFFAHKFRFDVVDISKQGFS